MNPVSILITGFHGNVMAIVPFLVVSAYVAAVAAEGNPNRRLLLAVSALLLGMAIGFRSFPILLIPVFLLLLDAHLS